MRHSRHYRKTVFDQYRTWLLNPQDKNFDSQASSWLNLDHALAVDHDWAAEAALTDVHEYSHFRTNRIINNNYQVPQIVLGLALRQMFQARDYMLQIPGHYDALLANSNYNLHEEFGALHVAHNPELMHVQEANLAALEKGFRSGDNPGVLISLRAAAKAVRFEYDSIYTNRLLDMLSPAEAREALILQPSIRAALYPATTPAGDAYWRQWLIETHAYGPFKHYDVNGDFVAAVT